MAKYLEIFIDQGANSNTVLVASNTAGYPINLTSSTVTSNAKSSASRTANVKFSFTCSVLDGANGVFALTTNATALSINGRFFYDVKSVDPSNNVTRLFEGIVNVDPKVT